MNETSFFFREIYIFRFFNTDAINIYDFEEEEKKLVFHFWNKKRSKIESCISTVKAAKLVSIFLERLTRKKNLWNLFQSTAKVSFKNNKTCKNKTEKMCLVQDHESVGQIFSFLGGKKLIYWIFFSLITFLNFSIFLRTFLHIHAYSGDVPPESSMSNSGPPLRKNN